MPWLSTGSGRKSVWPTGISRVGIEAPDAVARARPQMPGCHILSFWRECAVGGCRGIASARVLVATKTLGAEGFQFGTRFAASAEAAAHPLFKPHRIEAQEGDNMLTLKRTTRAGN